MENEKPENDQKRDTPKWVKGLFFIFILMIPICPLWLGVGYSPAPPHAEHWGDYQELVFLSPLYFIVYIVISWSVQYDKESTRRFWTIYLPIIFIVILYGIQILLD